MAFHGVVAALPALPAVTIVDATSLLMLVGQIGSVELHSVAVRRGGRGL